MLFPLPEIPFLSFLPNQLLFTLWTLTFGKSHFLRDTFSALPRPLGSIYELLLYDVPVLQGTYHTIIKYWLLLYVFPTLPSVLSLDPECCKGNKHTSSAQCLVQCLHIVGAHYISGEFTG